MAILKLRKPVTVNGETVDQIGYDLEGLSGKDVQTAVREVQAGGAVISVLELDSTYHAAMFARASGLSLQDMSLLSARDYNAAVALVRDFFLADSAE